MSSSESKSSTNPPASPASPKLLPKPPTTPVVPPRPARKMTPETVPTVRASDLALPPYLKLVGISNLKVWKDLMGILLQQNGLAEHLESDSKNIKDQSSSNALVKMAICTNIAAEFIPLIMAHELAAAGYTAMCRFIEGNSIAATKTAHREYVNLADSFERYSTPADYILAHKSCIEKLQSLDQPWNATMYSIHFICAVASKFPQWAANQDYLMTTATKENPAPPLETLYMTLQDHVRLQEIQALNAPPAIQAHQASNDRGGKKKDKNNKADSDNKDREICDHCGGFHPGSDCHLEHPEKIAEWNKKNKRIWKANEKNKAEWEKRKAATSSTGGANYSGFDSHLDNYQYRPGTTMRTHYAATSKPSIHHTSWADLFKSDE